MKLIAYRVSAGPGHELVPAPLARTWMSETRDGFANRCLPLLVANQAGWLITLPEGVRAVWNGGDRLPDVKVSPINPGGAPHAGSHFGHGIVTFTIPFLFRTEPGWNLLVRGPANLPKDGAAPLEGLIETDWNPATFTMNWKLTRPELIVEWRAGEPIAMLTPLRRGELESFDPEVRGIDADPEVAREYRAWRQARADFLMDLPVPGTDANQEQWQKDYLHGRRPDGTAVEGHQRKLSLRPFR